MEMMMLQNVPSPDACLKFVC